MATWAAGQQTLVLYPAPTAYVVRIPVHIIVCLECSPDDTVTRLAFFLKMTASVIRQEYPVYYEDNHAVNNRAGILYAMHIFRQRATTELSGRTLRLNTLQKSLYTACCH